MLIMPDQHRGLGEAAVRPPPEEALHCVCPGSIPASHPLACTSTQHRPKQKDAVSRGNWPCRISKIDMNAAQSARLHTSHLPPSTPYLAPSPPSTTPIMGRQRGSIFFSRTPHPPPLKYMYMAQSCLKQQTSKSVKTYRQPIGTQVQSGDRSRNQLKQSTSIQHLPSHASKPGQQQPPQQAQETKTRKHHNQ